MNTFYLEILSPERVFFKGECESLVVPISDGMLGIQANHSPLTSALCDGEVTFKPAGGGKRSCATLSGIVDVNEHRVRLLCESVFYPEEIDEEIERRALFEQELEAKNKQSEKDYKIWQTSFNKAINRLKNKSKENINM